VVPTLVWVECHPDSPCREYKRKVAHARRACVSMRGARVRDDLIARILAQDGYTQPQIDDAMSPA
jgi:hypothetical protein